MKLLGKQLGLFEKVLMGILVFLAVNSAYLHFKNWRLQNQLFNVVEDSKKEKQDSLKVVKKNITAIANKRRKRTKAVQLKSKEIDLKLKQDEKEINSSDVTDDDIADFITKHKER